MFVHRVVLLAFFCGAVKSSPPQPNVWTGIDEFLSVSVNVDTQSSTFGSIVDLKKVISPSVSSPSLVEANCKTQPPLWEISVVTDTAKYAYNLSSSDENIVRTVRSKTDRALDLLFEVPVGSGNLVNVQLSLKISETGNIELVPTISVEDSPNVGVWDWKINVGCVILSGTEATLFENAGFGVVHRPPQSFSGKYPQATMQYMASYGPVPSGSSVFGVYVGAHDPKASSKGLGCQVSSAGTHANFEIQAIAPNAGEGGINYVPTWPIVISAFENDWWDAAQIYRTWALASADWTKQGTMAQRMDKIPKFAFDLTTWINTHWQQNDIFNITGGDPEVVYNRVKAISERFGLSKNQLGLHWYEWDTLGYERGSNYSKCTSEVTCGFDTHYPEYFPVRSKFQEKLKAIQDMGVRVAPYINGRIFDQATKSWTAQGGAATQSAAKSAPATLNSSKTSLSLYNESYGSKAVFAVMCPHTKYWQSTIAEVVDKIVNKYETDGVYIDQIAAAGPRPCWDKSHGHPVGGGHHWVDGYKQMLNTVREKAGPNKVILTESNAEPFMDGINMFLTLVGFAGGDLPYVPSTVGSGKMIVPAFQSVYGGYVFFVGAMFYRADFLPDPDTFAAKVANQFMFGAQLGWFSLGGRSNHPQNHVFDLLMDPAYDAEILYLQRLSSAKAVAADYFNHGSALRNLDLTINGTNDEFNVRRLPGHPRGHGSLEGDNKVGLVFPAVMSTAWRSAPGDSILLSFTTVMRDTPAEIDAMLDLGKYGIHPAPSKNRCQVTWVPAYKGQGEKRLVGVYPISQVKIHLSLAPRDVVLLILQPVPPPPLEE
jgi:hypothetical protein